MTEAERQAILSSAKTFFRTRIAENHKANTEKLTSYQSLISIRSLISIWLNLLLVIPLPRVWQKH